jgi:hypothetical protein
MIQQDPYVFPGSWEREMFPDYKSAADLQRRFGYPTYYHREEWSIERKYKVAKLPNAAIYWVHDPIITR